jgi:hypothetical protein
MTTNEWEAMPLNARDDRTFKPFPRPPAVPDMPQPLNADANPAAHAVYMRVLADIKVAEGRRHSRSAIIMGPENAAAAIGDGTVLEQMRDTARNMRARTTAYLGTQIRPHSTTGRRSTVHPHQECSLPSRYDWKASPTRPSPSIAAPCPKTSA